MKKTEINKAGNLFVKMEKEVISVLSRKLSPELYYHSVEHTLDVINAAEKISIAEGLNENDINLVKIAALFHDSGFINANEDHEENSCHIATEFMTKYGYDSHIIRQVCEIIMATRIPQLPQNKLEEILCDADLDYLGREDFFTISNKLYEERKATGIQENKNDWNLKQVAFFNMHHYFTTTSLQLRSRQKQEHLKMLVAMIENNKSSV